MPSYERDRVIGDPSPEAIEFGSLVEPGRNFTSKLRYGGERHALLFGPNGSGKDTCILLPNLLSMSGARSLVVVDPKGELAAVSAPWRAKPKNQWGAANHVVILNPFGVLTEFEGFDHMKGGGFNPLIPLNPAAQNFDRDASALAEAVIQVDDKAQPHFSHSARSLLAALIMWVVIEAKKNGTVPTFARVRELLCQASDEGSPSRGIEAKGIPKLAAEMMKSSVAGLRNKAAQFTSWNKEIQSIASTAQTQTASFDEPEISECLSRNDLDWKDLKRRPTTVYLVIPPDSMERHGKWLRLMLTSALQASLRPKEDGEPSILFILNEMAGLGHLPIIENTWSQVRGYGIQMMPVFQDVGQIKNLYKDRWQTFVANAGIIASFAPNDSETAEFLSKRLGETTKLKTTTSRNWTRNTGNNLGQTVSPIGDKSTTTGGNEGESESSTSSESPEKVPFVTTDELLSMKAGHMVLITAGQKNGAKVFAPPYFRIESRKARARPNPYYDKVQRKLPSSNNSGGGFGGLFNRDGTPFGSYRSGSFDWNNSGTDTGWNSGDTNNGGDWFNEVFGRGSDMPPSSPAPKPKRTASPEKPINGTVAAKHPSYAPEPPKRLQNPAARHPSYTPDPSKQGDPFGEDDDASEYDDDT